MEKAIIIARVSTLKQEKEGLSLEKIQLPILRKYAEDNNLEIAKEFVFSESADRKIRKKFNEIIAFVKNHPGIKTIISYRVDRVTRNYRDAVLFDDLRMDYDKELHFVHDRLVLTKKSVGRDITDWDTKVYLAKQFLNRLKEDAIISALRKLENHEWPGKAPFGYQNVTQKDNKKWIIPDPFEAKVVRKMYEWYAIDSCSMLELCRKVKKEFNLKFSKGRVDHILKNPFYYGEMRYEGKIWPHRYEPLITKELFDKVQAVKASHHKKRFKYAGLPFLYRGLIRCADCGCMVTPERKIKKSGKVYHYYHCTEYNSKHGAEWLREEELTQQFASIFKKMQIPPEILKELVKSLKDSHQDKSLYYQSLRTDFQKEIEKYETRIEKMYEDKLDGIITKEFYDQRRKQYRQKQKKIQKKLNRLLEADESYYLNASYILELASRAYELFQSSELEERRQLLKFTLQNCVLDGRKVRYTWQKPFDVIAKYAPRQAWLRG